MRISKQSVRRLVATVLVAATLAACGGGDDAADDPVDDPTTTVAPDGTEADETTEPESSDPESSDPEGDVDETEPEQDPGDQAAAEAEAIALARRINLTIDDFADGWEADEAEDDGESGFDDCFVDTDQDEVIVGRAESPTFSVESADQSAYQLVGMQTVVYVSEEAATEVAAEVQTNQFAGCAEDFFLEGLGPDAHISLDVVVDDPPLTDESAGLVGAVVVPDDAAGEVDGLADLHLMRTGSVISYTITIDLGSSGAFESTLTELYGEIASRHANEIG